MLGIHLILVLINMKEKKETYWHMSIFISTTKICLTKVSSSMYWHYIQTLQILVQAMIELHKMNKMPYKIS
jgi:hypothetical protein